MNMKNDVQQAMSHAVQQLAEFLPELGFKATREIWEILAKLGNI